MMFYKLLERLRNRYAKKWHALFQALLYNSIYCIHFNIKSINIQVVLKILTKKKTHPYEWERYFFFLASIRWRELHEHGSGFHESLLVKLLHFWDTEWFPLTWSYLDHSSHSTACRSSNHKFPYYQSTGCPRVP